MEWQGWFSLALTFGSLLAMAFSRVGPHIVMMGALMALSVSGILTPKEALSGFGNEGLVTVAVMFMVAAGIYSSGGVDLLVNKLLGQPSTLRSALARMTIPVTALSAFLNNTPLVATMIPAVNAWARKIDVAPSKLMIPLSYSAIVGGTITLIGTSTNLVVNGQYQALTGNPGFSLFSITPLGLAVAFGGVLYMWLFFPKLLPDYKDKNAFGNLREFTLEVTVAHGGPLVGKTVEQAGLRHLKRVFLIEIERGDAVIAVVAADEKLYGGDRLVFAGDTQAISDLLRINGIVASVDEEHAASLKKDRTERCLVEAVVSPHCEAVGSAIRDAKFRNRYGAAVLAVARNGERVQGNLGNIILEAGDTLLLEARPAFVTRQRYNKDFLMINDLNTEQPRHDRAYLAWAILAAMVITAGFDWLSMLNAALLGVALMLVTGCCSIGQAEKSIDFKVIITIGASYALGEALSKTGVAAYLANGLVDMSGGKPWLLLIMTYAAVTCLTEIISNNAAAILILPIALEMTEKTGLNAEPFVFAIMMGASASFATPIGYQTNLMVYGPGNYRFSDFLRVGVPMNIFMGMITVTLLLLFWPLVKS
ncbi:MAG TPA: SLC13 family permease [Pseudomonadales bacterium]|nr:SLC13 family permease [Pseudomonadales bacterium]